MKRSISLSHSLRILKPRWILWMFSFGAVFLGIGLQLSPALPFPPPINFEDLQLGTKYKYGQKITTSRLTIAVLPFQWGNKQWYKNGVATVEGNKIAGGKGKEIFINNVNLGFNYNYPKGLSLRFRDKGGNVNIAINGEFRNIGNLDSLNNTTVGKVQVYIINQVLILKGNLNKVPVKIGREYLGDFSLVIGGQELAVDDINPLE